MKHPIYLDNSATTAVAEEVIETMVPFLRNIYGNASSIHIFGQKARTAVEDARREVAGLIGAEPREIVFTSGGTESDNAALWGVYRREFRKRNQIITTGIEHPAVLATCKSLQEAGAEVTYVRVDSSGYVDPARIAEAITDRTALISVMQANNETGVLQPIEEIVQLAREHEIVTHTDAVQSVGKIPIDVNELGVDLLSLSAHKVHGPKGVGALYVRDGVKIAPFLTGGAHERKRRGGTENVPGIMGFGTAAKLARERLPQMKSRVAQMRDHLENSILDQIPGVRINGSVDHRLPNVTNLSFDGLEGEAAVIALDLEGIALSTGSACSSGSLEPSHVLKAMGLRPAAVQSALRFSLCHYNTTDEINRAVDVLVSVTERIRKLSRRAIV
jgi:cysteine desulfurase